MAVDVTLPLDNPDAWLVNLTIQETMGAGTPYESTLTRNISRRAGILAPIPTYGLPATIDFSSRYQIFVGAYDEDLNYLGHNAYGSSMGWKTAPYTFTSPDARYLFIVAKSVPTEAAFTDTMLADMAMSITLAGGGGSMPDMMSRQEAYAVNVITGWQTITNGSPPYNSTGLFRMAGTGNGTRTFGHTDSALPMGATGYASIDTSAESCTNSDNCIAQDQIPLTVGETYTMGVYVRGRGYLTCSPTQDGYVRVISERIDTDEWIFCTGEFVVKAATQSFFLRNETTYDSDLAGKLDVCAPLLVRGGAASD